MKTKTNDLYVEKGVRVDPSLSELKDGRPGLQLVLNQMKKTMYYFISRIIHFVDSNNHFLLWATFLKIGTHKILSINSYNFLQFLSHFLKEPLHPQTKN